jgi:hypothetical protein
MRPMPINVGEKVTERQLAYPRDLSEALPELLLHGEARIMRANSDRPPSNS